MKENNWECVTLIFPSGTFGNKELDDWLIDLERFSNLVELTWKRRKEVLKQKLTQVHPRWHHMWATYYRCFSSCLEISSIWIHTLANIIATSAKKLPLFQDIIHIYQNVISDSASREAGANMFNVKITCMFIVLATVLLHYVIRSNKMYNKNHHAPVYWEKNHILNQSFCICKATDWLTKFFHF